MKKAIADVRFVELRAVLEASDHPLRARALEHLAQLEQEQQKKLASRRANSRLTEDGRLAERARVLLPKLGHEPTFKALAVLCGLNGGSSGVFSRANRTDEKMLPLGEDIRTKLREIIERAQSTPLAS